MTSKNIIEISLQIERFYSVFSEPISVNSSWSKLRICPGFYNPIMSPIFHLSSNQPTKQNIELLEAFFEEHNIKDEEFSSKTPYFGSILTDLNRLDVFKSASYSLSRETHYCFFDSIKDSMFKMHEFDVITNEYFSDDTYYIFQEQLNQNFQQNETFRIAFEKMIKSIPGQAYKTVIVNKEKSIVASGAFLIRGSFCLLLSGSVPERFRGNNFSRMLVEERKKVSNSLGATSWMYSTSNPKMASYFDTRATAKFYTRNKRVL